LEENENKLTSLNKTVADAALRKLANHLWYVAPELVPLALFSNKVSVEDKRHIAECMKHCDQELSVCGIRLEKCRSSQQRIARAGNFSILMHFGAAPT